MMGSEVSDLGILEDSPKRRPHKSMMFKVNRNPSQRELRTFVWAMPAGFSALALLAWLMAWRRAEDASLLAWTGSGWQFTTVTLIAVAAAFFVIPRLSPTAARRLYVAWMTLTVPLGILMSTILLSVIFFVVLPVFSLIVRFGDPLRKRLTADESYWETYKPHEPTLDRMRRLF